MSEQPNGTVLHARRVTVAISTGLRNLDVLDLAAALAAADQAELEALFVEDARLFHLAGLPFARELDTCSGAEQPLQEARVSADLRNRLSTVERALARAVAPHRLHTSVRIRRGDYLAEALSVTERVGVLILVREQSPGATRRRPQGASELFVLFDGSEAAARAVELGRRLASQRGARLRVLLDGGAADPAALKAALPEPLDPATSVRFEWLGDATPATLAGVEGLARGVLLGPLARLAAAPEGRRSPAALPAPVLILVS